VTKPFHGCSFIAPSFNRQVENLAFVDVVKETAFADAYGGTPLVSDALRRKGRIRQGRQSVSTSRLAL
jgi:hypothetical protein